MQPNQFVRVKFKLSTSRLNHLIGLMNAWSRCAVHYDRGPVLSNSLRWRPGDVHPLVVDDPINEDGDDENPPGDNNVPPVAAVVDGNILPGVLDDVVKADAVNMSGDDDDDLPAAAAGKQRKRKTSTDKEKNEKRQRRDTSENVVNNGLKKKA